MKRVGRLCCLALSLAAGCGESFIHSADGGDNDSTPSDPCAGIVCDAPPARYCVDQITLRSFAAAGTCANGQCSYARTDAVCAIGCESGACTDPDPCAAITCNAPPASSCVDGTTLRTYSISGTCSAGACSYSSTDTACAHGCRTGACLDDPCAGVICDSPPTKTCSSSTTLRAWSSPGTCNSGLCSYASSDMACANGCAAGACSADPCAGVTCNAPPAPQCASATLLRTYFSSGTCHGGACFYASSETTCSARCQAGACVATAVPWPAVGASPFAIVTVDSSHDGVLDLATSNLGGTVSFLKNEGDGTFVGPADYVVGMTPMGIASGSFDGHAGLAVADFNDGHVSVLLGWGDGGFQSAASYSAGDNPASVTAGDFNNDGAIDLAFVDNANNDVALLLGNGTGMFFPTPATFAVGPLPLFVASGDFNGDGKLDLVTGNWGAEYVSVLLGQGDGTFQAASSFPAGTSLGSPVSVTVGDFDGDGKLDLATADNDTNGAVSVLLGKGDGSFKVPRNFAVGANPASIVTGDFDGDGKLDLATANAGAASVSVLLGNGDGTFQSALAFPVGTQPQSVTAGDFNGDGKLDLATANEGTSNVSVLLGQGNGSFF